MDYIYIGVLWFLFFLHLYLAIIQFILIYYTGVEYECKMNYHFSFDQRFVCLLWAICTTKWFGRPSLAGIEWILLCAYTVAACWAAGPTHHPLPPLLNRTSSTMFTICKHWCCRALCVRQCGYQELKYSSDNMIMRHLVTKRHHIKITEPKSLFLEKYMIWTWSVWTV